MGEVKRKMNKYWYYTLCIHQLRAISKNTHTHTITLTVIICYSKHTDVSLTQIHPIRVHCINHLKQNSKYIIILINIIINYCHRQDQVSRTTLEYSSDATCIEVYSTCNGQILLDLYYPFLSFTLTLSLLLLLFKCTSFLKLSLPSSFPASSPLTIHLSHHHFLPSSFFPPLHPLYQPSSSLLLPFLHILPCLLLLISPFHSLFFPYRHLTYVLLVVQKENHQVGDISSDRNCLR